jgi:hypothetical protein
MKAPPHLFDSRVGRSQSVPEQLLVQIPSRKKPTIEEKPASDYSDSITLPLIVGLSFFALVFFMIRRLQSPKSIQNPLESPRFWHPVPCSKCRFFNKSPYLKCAVHPQSVNKIDAKECPDFWPSDQDKFHQK